MATARQIHHTLTEYLALEEVSPVRHEYLDGEIYAMEGGSPEHAALCAALIATLQRQLPQGCRAFTSDLRIRVEATGLVTHPDVAVICGRVARATADRLCAVNPILLAEVTSPSTHEYDRGEKLRNYQLVESVRTVAILSHDKPGITVHERAASGWTAREAGPAGAVEIASLGVILSVDALYGALDGL